MDQNPSATDSLAEKWNFLQKYDSTSKLIKPHAPCYAVSNEWYSPSSSFSPIIYRLYLGGLTWNA